MPSFAGTHIFICSHPVRTNPLRLRSFRLCLSLPSFSAKRPDDKTINQEFEIDPEQNFGVGYQFSEVVRDRAQRKRMHAFDCECCKGVSNRQDAAPWLSPPHSNLKSLTALVYALIRVMESITVLGERWPTASARRSHLAHAQPAAPSCTRRWLFAPGHFDPGYQKHTQGRRVGTRLARW